MEHQKIINLLDYTPYQPCKFRTGNWVEINDDSRGNYNTIIKLDLQLQCEGQLYLIIVMHISLLMKL